jgi:conjugal transfer mating pair stabilization protein TraG
MYHQYGEGHTVIDSSGAISQLPFKASMTRGYASDLRNQGQWYMNEAERIENGTSATWSSSRGTFGSAVAASSEVSGSRSERGSRSSDTHNVGGNVMVEGSSGKSTREVTNDDLILRQGNSRSSGNFDQRGLWRLGAARSKLEQRIGTPGKDLAGSGVSAGLGASIFGRTKGMGGFDARTGSERSATNQVTRGTDKSEDVGSRVVVSGNSGDVQSSGTFSQNSDYTDASQSRTTTDGTDWRIAEADERRAAAARYREIGGRMMSEASYAESHGFQVSSDMSNLIQDRYEALQREHPEWHLPDISNPRLDYRDLARRDQAISYIMDDLMSDLRNRRIDELADVADIAGQGCARQQCRAWHAGKRCTAAFRGLVGARSLTPWKEERFWRLPTGRLMERSLRANWD